MSATLVLRTVKGSPLTNLEVDNNFSNINTFASTIDSNVGVLGDLTTSVSSNVVAAVNEVRANVTTIEAAYVTAAGATSNSIVYAIALG